MSCTHGINSVGVSVDIGSSTSKILAYKISKTGVGRPPSLFVCRVHACGFYSNRSWNMQQHFNKMHRSIQSETKSASTSDVVAAEPNIATISHRLQQHLLTNKPKLEKDISGYLKDSTDCLPASEPPIPQEKIDELVQGLAKLNLSFDTEDIPEVIQSVDIKVYEINDGVVSEFNPIITGKCPHWLSGEKCKISKRGSKDRNRCFGIDSPFLLTIPIYACTVHKSQFSILKVLTPQCHTFPSLVILPQTIVTRAFLNHIFNLAPGHYFNFSKMLTTIQTTWMSNIESRLQSAVSLRVKTDAAARADIAKVNDLMKTTASFLEGLYFVAHNKMKLLMENQMLDLKKNTGKVLRIDHTYKVVKNLSAYSHKDGKRVQIKASLFTVLNEKGQVLSSKIVPSDERKYVASVLQEIWDTEGRSVVTTHLFTDNSVADKNTVRATWLKSAYKGHACPSTNQDLWHALHRIEQVMNHKHPDYHKARKQLSDTLNEATVAESLKTRLFDWCRSFEVLHASSADSLIKKLAAMCAVSRAERKKKIFADYTSTSDIKYQHSAPLVDSRVRHAITNLANNYAEDILPTSSLPEGIKQGTSANEAWHKYLAKNFAQDSGSISIELATAVISHLQYIYNNRTDYNPLTNYINVASTPILNATIDLQHKSVVEIEKLGFRLKQMNWLKPRAADIEQCKKHLAQIHSEQHSVGISLLFYLSHYKFENAYCKSYVKKVLLALEKESSKFEV